MWQTPHFILRGWVWWPPTKVPSAFQTVCCPGRLLGHHELAFPNQVCQALFFSQEAHPIQGPELWEEDTAQGLGTASFPGCSPAAGSLEGKLILGQPCGVWAGLVAQLVFTLDLTENLSGLPLSQPPLDDDLSSRRLLGLFLVPSFSDQLFYLFRDFCFLQQKVEQER